MDNPLETADRLTALEVKVTLAEDALDQLNTVVYRQQQIIDSLVRELAALRDRVPAEGTGAFRSLRDELPPHY
ncbi:MAG: SlyX family protein [Burkholderiaceae bacterium]|nr:SlyX family protein [Burkholderiaceae bacterium]